MGLRGARSNQKLCLRCINKILQMSQASSKPMQKKKGVEDVLNIFAPLSIAGLEVLTNFMKLVMP